MNFEGPVLASCLYMNNQEEVDGEECLLLDTETY